MIRSSRIAVVLLAGLLTVCIGTTAFAINYDLTVNGDDNEGEVPHFWSRCCGTGGAQLCLKDEWKVAAKIGVEEAGFEAYRGHRILSASNPLRWSGGNSVTYDWTTFDQIYDFLVDSLGTVPIVELSAQPRDLETSGEWSPPKDLNVYRDLIERVVSHCIDRYGMERVSKWYWEVWNEWDYEGFWQGGTEQQYYEMYKYAVEGAKSAYPDIKIGGPSTTISGSDRLSNFLNYCKSNNVKVDLVTNHCYGGGASGPNADAVAVRNDNRRREDAIRNFGQELISMNTEYSSSYNGQGGNSGANCYSMDNHINAPFVAKCVKLILDDHTAGTYAVPDVLSYWAISDVFDEGSYIENNNLVPFGQVFGLINYQGIRKATFNAFKMLHMMGTIRLSLSGGTGEADGVDGFATVNDDNSQVAVMVYNFYKSLDGQTAVDDVALTVNNLPLSNGEVEVRHYRVDETHSNAYDVWIKQGKPARPSTAQWDEMRAASNLAELGPMTTIDYSGNPYTETFTLPRQSVSLLLFKSSVFQIDVEDPLSKANPAFLLKGTTLHVADARERPIEIVLYGLDGKIVKCLRMASEFCDLRQYLPKGIFLVRVLGNNPHIIRKIAVY